MCIPYPISIAEFIENFSQYLFAIIANAHTDYYSLTIGQDYYQYREDMLGVGVNHAVTHQERIRQHRLVGQIIGFRKPLPTIR